MSGSKASSIISQVGYADALKSYKCFRVMSAEMSGLLKIEKGVLFSGPKATIVREAIGKGEKEGVILY